MSGTRDGRVHTAVAVQSAYTSQDAGRTHGPRLTEHTGTSSAMATDTELWQLVTHTNIQTAYFSTLTMKTTTRMTTTTISNASVSTAQNKFILRCKVK